MIIFIIEKFNTDMNDLSYRLDIRGKRAEEAELEILRFLDYLQHEWNLTASEILHGKGTGALNTTFSSNIKGYVHVKNLLLCNIEYGAGGDGLQLSSS
jgi:dsDNA-specific endonuclease/ATPase MutS2